MFKKLTAIDRTMEEKNILKGFIHAISMLLGDEMEVNIAVEY